MSAIALAILAFAAAIASPAVRFLPRLGPLVVAGVPFGLGCWFASALPGVSGGESVGEVYRWVPDLGAALAFRVDGLSLTFALLICFIGSLVLLYAGSYMASHPRRPGFMATLTSFMVAMLGLVLADNVVVLFVFWELTSITSFLLIGFDFHREAARKSALQALLTTGLGGLALLAGLVLLGLAGGTFSLSGILERGAEGALHGHRLYLPAVLCVLLGCFTKSAVFPFHYWLPNAMEAPSPVSALLHSATMVKAGVYLLARLHPALGGTPLWDLALTGFGAATMLIAAFLATRQNQLKRILAYSTVSSLGTLVMLIGMHAAKAAATYLLAHALFKGCLFLVAGTLTKKTGEKDPEKLGGLLGRMPVTALASFLAALSMAGLFPLAGFAGKELMLKAGLAHERWSDALTALIVASAVLTVMAALLAGFRPFIGRVRESGAEAHDPDWRQAAGPVTLAALGVVAGVAPGLFAVPLVTSTMGSIEGSMPEYPADLDALHMLWPPTTATVLSFVALALGLGLYLARGPYRAAGRPLAPLGRMGPARWYDLLFAGLMRAAAIQTRVLQNGSLQAYVRVTVLVAVAVAAAALARTDVLGDLSPTLRGATPIDWAVVGSLIIAAVASTLQRTALASVAVLGVVGFTIALLFALFGAPDLAMTQFAVETLVVIIFVLVIFHLPRYSAFTSVWRRVYDALCAASLGLLMAVFTLAVIARPATDLISVFHAERSAPEAFGRNVVNVILVDFRAMDTLGEVFVIGVAAIGVFTLLKLRPEGDRPPAEGPGGGGPAS